MLFHLLGPIALGGSLEVGLHPDTPADRLTVRVAVPGEPVQVVKADPAEVTAIPGPPDDTWLWIELETPNGRTARLLEPDKPQLRALTSTPLQADTRRAPIRYLDLDGHPIPGLHTGWQGGEITSRDGWLGTRAGMSETGLPGGWRIPWVGGMPPADLTEVVLPVRRVPVRLEGALYPEGDLERSWEPWRVGLATRDFVDSWLPVGTFIEEWLDGETPRRRRIAVPERGRVVVTELVPEAVTVRVEIAPGGDGWVGASQLFVHTGPGEGVMWPRARPIPVSVWQRRGTGPRAIPDHQKQLLLEPGEDHLEVPLAHRGSCQPWKLRAVPEGLFVQSTPAGHSYRSRDPSALDELTWGMILTSANGTSLAGWTDPWLTAKRAEIDGPLELAVVVDGTSSTLVIPPEAVCHRR